MMIFGAAVFGGFSTLIVQRVFFKEKPKQIPVFLKADSDKPPIQELAPKEVENRISINRCVDLYTYICTLPKSKDPTGSVYRDAEGEVAVLRIAQNILSEHKMISKKKADELLVEKVYSKERVERVRKLYEQVKLLMVDFIDSQPFKALTLEEKEIIKNKIQQVVLELPPPLSLYADDLNLITKNEVYYLRMNDGKTKVRIGGALLFTLQSDYNLAFTMAHEIAHSIDPCELREIKQTVMSYQDLNRCFDVSEEELATECKPEGKISEIFSDWIATQIVADLIFKQSNIFTSDQIRTSIYNSVRDLCMDEEAPDDDFRIESEQASSQISDHPSPSFRVNHIFAQHPKIRKLLGCKESEGPTLPGVPSYCFFGTNSSPKKSIVK